jgi:uncharacterized protein YqjF (DUF2071 family)
MQPSPVTATVDNYPGVQGRPVKRQSWGKLLFMHWPVPPDALRRLIPAELMLDTFAGEAWLGVTPFTIYNARSRFLPPLPWISHFHELNVRTYVQHEGVAGVWFFSLDADSLVAVLGARMFFHLPYHSAAIRFESAVPTLDFRLRRKGAARQGQFQARWSVGESLPTAEPGTLEHFLVERYCLYTVADGTLCRGQIRHEPWPLQQALLRDFDSDIFEADGLLPPSGEPLVHSAGPVHVNIWPLEKVP